MALHLKVPPVNPHSYVISKGQRSSRNVDCGSCRGMKVGFACSLWRPSNSDQIRLQLSCTISQRRWTDLVADMQLHSLFCRPQMQNYRCPSRSLSKKALFCASSRNSNVVEDEFLDRGGGAEPGADTNLVADFLLTEGDRSSYAFDKHLTPNDAGDQARRAVFEAESTDALETAAANVERVSEQGVQVAWVQKHFQKLVRPIIRVLSGANFNNPKDIAASTRHGEHTASWSLLRMLTGSLPPGYYRRRIGGKLRQAEADFFTFASQLGKFLFIMMATGAILATGFQLAGGDSQEETLLWCSWLAGIIVGSMIGAEKVMQQRCRSGPRNVVITGSTRGLGKALAREFLFAGDRVVIASRSSDLVAKTVKELQDEAKLKTFHPFLTANSSGGDFPSRREEKVRAKVVGMACDVSKVDDVRGLAEFAVHKLGSIDIWINNAGANKGFRPLVQFSDADIQQIVSANLIGSLICTREAIQVMMSQSKGGHVFNMDGAGSGGSSTPLTAVYGSTKCGLRQLHATLLKECRRSRVGIHTASPGMVLTDLLLSGASLQNKKMFNIICELPETVASALVPRMRDVKGTGKAINFLTPPRILFALVTAWLRRGRWFDEEGRAVYAAEADRVRNWAEGRTRLPVSAAIDQFSDTTWVSVFSITVICAFIMLSTSGNGIPGT